jgi:hypothetical protein
MTELTIPIMPQLWTMDEMCVSYDDVLGSLAKWAVRQSPYLVPDQLREAIEQFEKVWPFADNATMSGGQLGMAIYEAFPECAAIMAWNHPTIGDHQIAFVSRYDRPKPDHDFIDLHALARNIAHDIILAQQVSRAQDATYELATS